MWPGSKGLLQDCAARELDKQTHWEIIKGESLKEAYVRSEGGGQWQCLWNLLAAQHKDHGFVDETAVWQYPTAGDAIAAEVERLGGGGGALTAAAVAVVAAAAECEHAAGGGARLTASPGELAAAPPPPAAVAVLPPAGES